MSDTPRVDEVLAKFADAVPRGLKELARELAITELARDLERENALLRDRWRQS